MKKKTYRVNRSGLIADKEIYRIWFGFYQLALVSKDPKIQAAMRKSRKFYAEWGTDAAIHFDDWWDTHSHLFEDLEKVRLLGKDEQMNDRYVYVAVPKIKSVNVAVDEIRTLLTDHFKVSRSRRTQVPQHRFAPTEIQGLKRGTLSLQLDLSRHVFGDPSLKGKALYERVRSFLQNERYKRKKNELPEVLRELDSGDENAQRNVRRYRERCKKILINVANGIFPG